MSSGIGARIGLNMANKEARVHSARLRGVVGEGRSLLRLDDMSRRDRSRVGVGRDVDFCTISLATLRANQHGHHHWRGSAERLTSYHRRHATEIMFWGAE